MPISLNELKNAMQKEATPLSERILEFLRKNPEQAFTKVEIYAAIEEIKDSSMVGLLFAMDVLSKTPRGSTSPFQQALDELVVQKRVFVGTVKSESYYSIGGM